MAKVIEIIAAHLVNHGFDGLVSSDLECGCEIGDLEPCDSVKGDCRPAYRGADLTGYNDWAMYLDKDVAARSVAEAAERAKEIK